MNKKSVAPKNLLEFLHMKEFLLSYNAVKKKTLEEIIAFHYELDSIHPFFDGNGRHIDFVCFLRLLRYTLRLVLCA